MTKRYGSSETKEESVKQKGLNFNECPSAEQVNESLSESSLKAERESYTLGDCGMEITPNVDHAIEMKRKKTVKLDREVLITRRVLRSGTMTRDPANSDEHHVPVKVKTNKELSKGDNVSKISGTSFRSEVKHEQEIHGDDFKVEYKDARFEDGQSPKVTKILKGDSRSDIVVEIKDDRSYDENVDVQPHDEELKVKRKRGRPKKLQVSSQSDENGSSKNCKLARSQSSVDRLNLKCQRGRPPKTKEPDVGLSIRKENVNCRHGSTLIKPEKSTPKSIEEPRRPESNYICRDKGPESDGGHCRGRKILRKRGRPLTPQKERKSGSAYESGCRAKKRLKLCGSPLESPQDNPVTDRETRDGEQQNKQNEAGQQSRSKSKKMLSDRILQLLLAAGWTVEYRPRNGRAYKDAVYVNPEGKTHWSVTKAYKVYKEYVESIMKDQMNSTSGSGFGLLPEEDLHLLGRKVKKKRCDTGKGRPKWKEGDTNENTVSTKRIGKCTLRGKRLQKGNLRLQKLIPARLGKKKGNRSHASHNLERTSVSVRKIKREVKHNRKRCALSARSSLEDVDSKENGYILFEGKRTMLGWMIDSAIVPLNGKVQCMNCKKTEVLLEGMITKEGVRCNCCDKVFALLDFEIHAGRKQNQPFESLYLEDGNSLLQSVLEFWNKQSESLLKGFHIVDFGGGDPNDDTCGICGDGGDLICCDGCPSTFHQSCLDIKKFPSGAWFCYYCSCKFCKRVEEANHDTATLPPLSSCSLCEEKYHQACIKQGGTVPGERTTRSFCGKDCQELFEGLDLLIGVKHPLPEGFSWTFLRRFELPCEVRDCEKSDKIAYNTKVAVAFSVMDECFSPLVDHRSGVNLLQNIVYNFGSNFHRLNYSSFITAVLERGDEIIAVASIRIHGNQLAEMPFIGTRYMYRRQGMCRRLMSGIESALSSLKVDKLVIPAVPELMDTWTSGFGFGPVHESERKSIKNLNLLVFPGVDMLEKSLLKESITESTESSCKAPEMSLPEDVQDNKFEKSKDHTHEKKCTTAEVQSSSYLVDSCKSMSVEEGDSDAKPNLKLHEGEEQIRKVTEKDVDSLPAVVDDCSGHSQRESNSRVVDDAHANQINTKQKSGDVVDDTQLSDGSCGGKADTTEESDQQPDCYISDQSHLRATGSEREETDNKSLAVNRDLTTTLRVSPRVIQRSWRASPVKQKYTGTNAVLIDSPQRYV